MKLPHTCGSRDALQVFEQEDGSLDGFCFACRTSVPDPLGEGKTVKDIPAAQRLVKTDEEIQEEIEEIESCVAIDLPARRLRGASLDKFGIKVGMSYKDGVTPAYIYFPYTKKGDVVGYKVKMIDGKKFWSVGNIKDSDLFGWEQAKRSGAQRLIITEGELDAVAMDRIFELYEKDEYKHTIPAIVSLPHGASSASKELAKNMSEIRRHFKQISFAFDDDEAGRKALDEACKLFPDATTITLPAKDANACLIEGLGKQAYQAAKWKADVQKNSRLVCLDDVWEAAKEPAKFGVSWPWKHITELTRGIRLGETIYIGAAQKMG
jgi:twinkle protein